MRRFWTPEEDNYMRQHYPDCTAQDVAAHLNRSDSSVYSRAKFLGLSKSDAFRERVRAMLRENALNNPLITRNRFKPGQKAWNHGRKCKPGEGGLHPNSRKHHFKTGLRGRAERLYREIGETRITRDGTLEQKVSDEGTTNVERQRRWVPVARIVWERDRGPIPDGHVVRFKDGQATNVFEEITIDRLECISMAENMRRNSVMRLPEPVRRLVHKRAGLSRRIHNMEKIINGHTD